MGKLRISGEKRNQHYPGRKNYPVVRFFRVEMRRKAFLNKPVYGLKLMKDPGF